MQINFLLFYFGISLGICSAQQPLMANAGEDREICNDVSRVISVRLGGSPSATGGMPPYSFSWEILKLPAHDHSMNNITASEILNDASLPNPLLTNNPDEISFILIVTDAAKKVSRDTVMIRFSNYDTRVSYYNISILKGDSIFLNYGSNIQGGFPPYQYMWKPNKGLRDSTSLSFWSKPDSSVNYYLTVVDSAGCIAIGSPFYFVEVKNEAVLKNDSSDLVSVSTTGSDNYTNIRINVELPGKVLYEVFDTKGKIIFQSLTADKSVKINNGIFGRGENAYKVSFNGKVIGNGTFTIH